MTTRREFLQLSAMAGAAWLIPWKSALAQLPGGSLDPTTIPKYVTPLVIPPAMPAAAVTPAYDSYRIAVRQFQQQILPPGFPQTTVWSYGSQGMPGAFNYPAFTIEAKYNRETRVRWANELLDLPRRVFGGSTRGGWPEAVMETPAVTVTVAVAVLPRESVTCTTSVTLPVGPAA